MRVRDSELRRLDEHQRCAVLTAMARVAQLPPGEDVPETVRQDMRDAGVPGAIVERAR